MSEDGERIKELLQSGIITLTGGRDVQRNLILTVPTDKLSRLEEWRVQDLTSLFLCQADISKYLYTSENGVLSLPSGPYLVCVSDLRSVSSLCIKQLVDTLETVEHVQRGTIAAVYFLKPRTKTKSHLLKKMLGVKPSKKSPKVPLFKVILMKTPQELHAQVDASQLTLDFFGTLQYNHRAWMQLYEVVIECIKGGQQLLYKLPSVRDRVDLLHEYDTENYTSAQLQQLLSDLTEKYQMILAESGLSQRLLQTKQTLFSLDQPSNGDSIAASQPIYSSLSSSLLQLPNLREGLRACLQGIYTKLDQHSQGLEEGWKLCEGKLTVLIQVQRHRERAKEIESKIRQHYQPLLQEHPIVGKTLSQAELYRAHFTTTLHEPAKELLSQATEILEAVHKLKVSETMKNVSTALSKRRSSVIPGELSALDVSDITNCLTSSMQPFAAQLQRLQQVYINIHVFHLLFEKALSWYKKVLKFLPDSLLERCTMSEPTHQSKDAPSSFEGQTSEVLLYMPSEWLGAVRMFLSRHPPPRQEHIDRLDESIPHLVDKRLKAQARSLALRLRLLQRILSGTRLPLRLLQAVVGWKTELFGLSSQTQERLSPSQQGDPSNPARDRHRGAQSSMTPGKSASLLPSEENLYGKSGSTGKNFPFKGVKQKGGGIPGFDFENSPVPGSIDLHFERTLYHDTESKTGPGIVKATEKSYPIPHRRNPSTRAMLRARSVDFNFNSSSTDGSVFDYDRAVLGIREEQDNLPKSEDVKSFGTRHFGPGRKQQSSTSLSTTQAKDRMRHHVWKDEEQAFSDPSELPANSRKRANLGVTDSREVLTDISEKGDHPSTVRRFHHVDDESTSPPDPEPDSFMGLPQPQSYQQLHQHPQPSAFPSPERFIRINLSPRKTKDEGAQSFSYPEDKQQHWEGGNENSGVNTAEGDPYDNIMNLIQEISSSNCTSAEKLHQVSRLLARKKGEAPHRDGHNKLKSAKSSFDIRKIEHEEEGEVIGADGEQVNPGERPLHVIQRMKQNLAKSMDELNKPSHYKKEKGKNGKQRYRSELRIDPIYSKPTRTVEDQRLAGRKQSFSDIETSKSSPLMTSPGDGTSRTRTTSDADADYHTWLAGYHSGEGETQPGDNMEGLRATRPSSLTFAYSRNFISPSFLRPAISMQDLVSQPLTSANLGLLQEQEAEADFRNIHDMEMLRALQEEENLLDNPQIFHHKTSAGQEERKTAAAFPNVQGFTADSQKIIRDGASSTDIAEKSVPGKDIVANFVMLGGQPRFDYKKIAYGGGALPLSLKSESQDSASPTWMLPATVADLYNRPAGSSSEEERGSLPVDTKNIKRLSAEADAAYQSQEEVAQTLRNTLMILETEESKQRQHLQHLSPGEERMAPEIRALINQSITAYATSASTDNGYGSWASQLAPALSFSSDGAVGADQETDQARHYLEGWKNPTSSDAASASSFNTEETKMIDSRFH